VSAETQSWFSKKEDFVRKKANPLKRQLLFLDGYQKTQCFDAISPLIKLVSAPLFGILKVYPGWI